MFGSQFVIPKHICNFVMLLSSRSWERLLLVLTIDLHLLGFGCDTEAVINILAHRDATQRSLIEQEYKAMYGEDLSKRLASELRGDVEVLWRIQPNFYQMVV